MSIHILREQVVNMLVTSEWGPPAPGGHLPPLPESLIHIPSQGPCLRHLCTAFPAPCTLTPATPARVLRGLAPALRGQGKAVELKDSGFP